MGDVTGLFARAFVNSIIPEGRNGNFSGGFAVRFLYPQFPKVPKKSFKTPHCLDR
jgi:hypothetical protein